MNVPDFISLPRTQVRFLGGLMRPAFPATLAVASAISGAVTRILELFGTGHVPRVLDSPLCIG